MTSYDQLKRFAPTISQLVRYIYFKSFARIEQDLPSLRNKLLEFGDLGRGFFDAIKGAYLAMKERDAFLTKIYKYEDPKKIEDMAENFKNEAFRPTVDEYEKGFLLCWEIILKTLSTLKREYPEYPLKDEENKLTSSK
ncbi:MAG: hypothetical protein NZ922_02765 [Candidatus Methanomethyliaceae archaeon]|nr:hypothetical protein [Candidatus Methanomethyliaceae archaeon]MDW7970952.1 hypothetical protein [Nitrososphaerota archaeon]